MNARTRIASERTSESLSTHRFRSLEFRNRQPNIEERDSRTGPTQTMATTTWAARHPRLLMLGPLVFFLLLVSVWLRASSTRSCLYHINKTGQDDDNRLEEKHQSWGFHLLTGPVVGSIMKNPILHGEGRVFKDGDRREDMHPDVVAGKDRWVWGVTTSITWEMHRHHHYLEQSSWIHTVVSFGVAFAVLLLTLLYALFCVNGRPVPMGEATNGRRSQRREQLLDELTTCRIRLSSTDWRVQSFEDCPICLSPLLTGQVVVESKFCSCNRNERAFHQQCLVPWLLEKRRNPHKLCPCCRQPFLRSDRTLHPRHQ